jgi:hypothetical protein
MNIVYKILALVAILIVVMASSLVIYSSYNAHNNKKINGQITFVERGLSNGTNWSVQLKANDYSRAKTTNSTSIAFSDLRNEVYTYHIAKESGFCLRQSGQTNGNGYSGSLYLGDYENISYPTTLNVNLTYVLVTPYLENFGFSNQSTNNNASYSIGILSISSKISLSDVELCLINAKNTPYSMILSTALNNLTVLNETWNITVSGSNYLSGGTGISINENKPIPKFDPFLIEVKIIDIQTNGQIGKVLFT